LSEGKEAVYTGQGTRLSERAPWETWDEEWEESIPEDLADEIKAYSEKRYEEGQSSSESQEVLAQLREENDELSEQYQWLTRAEYDDEKAREGRVMAHTELINKLRAAGIQCFYRQHVHADKAVLYVVKNGKEEMAAWVQMGYMPELSIMNFDAHGSPLAEKRRGWRTVLLQMILKGLITEEVTEKVFGKPKLTAAFSRYNATLYEWRNREGGWDRADK
jgi:cupin superfamily acireductone dioxygenase involved in methionine salvage